MSAKENELRVALAARRRARLEYDPAAHDVHDRERVRVTVRINTDHVVQLICKHPYRPPALGWGTTPVPVWR